VCVCVNLCVGGWVYARELSVVAECLDDMGIACAFVPDTSRHHVSCEHLV
jgi:hypothetical protein